MELSKNPISTVFIDKINLNITNIYKNIVKTIISSFI